MKKIIRQLIDNKWSILILCIYLLIIFLFSYFVIWQDDNLLYKLKFEEFYSITNNRYELKTVPFNSILEIFSSQYIHYFYINGRSLAHVLVQLFCGFLGKTWFAIFNTIFYFIFISISLRISKTTILNYKSLLSFIILFTIGLTTLFEPNCQIGYIWMFTVDLVFLYIFFLRKDYKKKYLPILAIFSFIAGWSHEGLVIGIGGALIIYFIQNLKKLPISRWVMIIFFGFGAFLLCFSPASLKRASNVNLSWILSIINIISYLPLFWILVFLLFYKKVINKINLVLLYKDHKFLFDILFILITFNLIIGIHSYRQMLGAELISSILIIRIIDKRAFNSFWLILGSIFILWQMSLQAIQCHRIYMAYNNFINIRKQHNVKEVYIDIKNTGPSKWLFIETINPYLGYLLRSNYEINTQKNEFKRLLNINEDFKIKPKYEDINNSSDSVINFGNGEWLMITNKSKPLSFKIYRSIKLGPLKYPYKAGIINLEENELADEKVLVQSIGESDMSHLAIDSITIIRK